MVEHFPYSKLRIQIHINVMNCNLKEAGKRLTLVLRISSETCNLISATEMRFFVPPYENF